MSRDLLLSRREELRERQASPPGYSRSAAPLRSRSRSQTLCLLLHCPPGDRIEQVQAARVVGASLAITLPGVVEGALGVQKLDKTGLTAAVRIFYSLSDIICLLEHPGFNALQQVVRGSVPLGGVLRFVANIRLQGANLSDDLLLLLLCALYFTLVAVEDREGTLKEIPNWLPSLMLPCCR